MLPESFLTPYHLPFNQTCLASRFEFLTHDQDPGDRGSWLLIQGGELALFEDGQNQTLPDGTLPPGIDPETALYIGQWQGRPCRVVSLDPDTRLPDQYLMRGLTSQVPKLSIELLSLGGLARQILYWDANSQYCGRCGRKQSWLPGEWGKVCEQCGTHHFPHIHPCIIVVVRRVGEILMTRKAEWPEGRYSLVAGFLDMGECLEEAVIREVKEETGVEVENIRYIGSQSWPFPSQLMCGFVADYAGGEVVVEEKELEDVRWFPIDALPNLPPKRSISRYLIDNFKEQG
ncbi:MAG: NAD(+) diphosphatase [Desulfuromonas sp.]|nr:MAG: NAD(+) diphosphatase [Desulfuromonas sp.]